MRSPQHSPNPRQVSSGRKIALNFLPLNEQDFSFTIYRRKLGDAEQAVPGTRWLPINCIAENKGDAERFRYAVSLAKNDDYQEAAIRAWVNPALTVQVLYEALVARTRTHDLIENCEVPDSEFLREVGFVLRGMVTRARSCPYARSNSGRTDTSACCASSHFVSLLHQHCQKRLDLNSV
jgi:hypothetical protein